MFVELGQSLTADAVRRDPNRRQFIERLLSSHCCGNIILIASRRDILEFKSQPLSDRAHLTLNFISNRLQEYQVAAQRASRVIVAQHPDELVNWHFERRDRVHVGMSVLTMERLHTPTFVLGEHVNDIRFLENLLSLFLVESGYPIRFINFRISQGGGSALAEAMAIENPNPKKGLVIVDKDISDGAPPFRQGTTARTAFDRAKMLHLCGDELGWSATTPFFVFMATWGRMLENYVGPNLLQAYFVANRRPADQRLVVNAFSNFPRLEEWQIELWRTLNAKEGTSPREFAEVLSYIQAVAAGRYGQIRGSQADYMSFKIPGDVTEWITQNAFGTRHSKTIRQALIDDARNDSYRYALADLANNFCSVTAGDKSAMRI